MSQCVRTALVMYVRPCPVEFSGREPAVQLFVTASYEDILEPGSYFSYFTNYQDVSC